MRKQFDLHEHIRSDYIEMLTRGVFNSITEGLELTGHTSFELVIKYALIKEIELTA